MSSPRPCYPLIHVEDDLTVLRGVARLLSRSPCELHGVATLSEARARLASRDDWCGVLADQHLPDGRGLDLVREARARLPEVPVRVMTGDDSPELANELHRAGVACIRKPFDRCDLDPLLGEMADFERSPRGPRVTAFAKERDLTARETEVLRASLDTLPLVLTARRLGMSLSTLRGHRARVLRKSSAMSFADLCERLLG